MPQQKSEEDEFHEQRSQFLYLLRIEPHFLANHEEPLAEYELYPVGHHAVVFPFIAEQLCRLVVLSRPDLLHQDPIFEQNHLPFDVVGQTVPHHSSECVVYLPQLDQLHTERVQNRLQVLDALVVRHFVDEDGEAHHGLDELVGLQDF